MPNQHETTLANKLVDILRNMCHGWELETEVKAFIQYKVVEKVSVSGAPENPPLHQGLGRNEHSRFWFDNSLTLRLISIMMA